MTIFPRSLFVYPAVPFSSVHCSGVMASNELIYYLYFLFLFLFLETHVSPFVRLILPLNTRGERENVLEILWLGSNPTLQFGKDGR